VSAEKDQIKIWRRDIPLFIWQVFKVKPTGQQIVFLNSLCDMVWAKLKLYTWNTKGTEPHGAVTDYDRKLNRMFGQSVMAGVGTGKGACAAWLIIWFLTCFPNPKIVITSSSAKQLGITLWAELAKWHERCALKDWFTYQSDKFYLTEKEGHTWFAATRTANTKNSPDEQAETLAGLHEDFLLIIADEASGIPDPVFRPLESTLTRKCNLCLLFFNPTKSRGFAHDTQYKDRENWMQHRWDAEECSLVTVDSIERLARKYGRDSNTFRIRVKGLPPTSGENHVIPWDYIESAVERELEPVDDDVLIYSLDVGAGGDDNVILPLRGPLVMPLMVSNSDDSRVLTNWAVDKVATGEPRVCLVDNIGVGWAVVGSLREKIPADACDIIEVNVSNTAFNPHRYFRLRDELWWRLRIALEDGQLSLPNDPLLMGDLNSPRYEEVAGKIKVETKKDMKSRGIDSPNRADALMMTRIYTPDILRKLHEMGGLGQRKKRKKSNVSWKTL
jgi:phage terminase large subunit